MTTLLRAATAACLAATTACLPSAALRQTAAPRPRTARAAADGGGSDVLTPLDSVATVRAAPESADAGDPPTAMTVRVAGEPRTTAAPGPSGAVNSADVQKRARDVFGDSAATDSAGDSGDEVSWDIDVHSYEGTDRVAHFVQLFSGPAKERVEESLDRGTRYEPMIRAAFRRGGLPEDLYYLALVESAFDPDAYSRAAAVGMWQFMTSTARDLGLRVDWWIDERRDPVRSTDAAVRFMKDLQDQFGSLYLAAAAYNGGPGRIARGLDRYADDFQGTTGDDLFFALADKDYLRHETRDYVPQLIAAALVGKDPSDYGLTITPEAPLAYDSVRVGPSIAIAAIARATHATVKQIMDLNPQILRGVTPPSGRTLVRIPPGTAEGFDDALAALPREVRVGLATKTTHKGETAASLAKQAGISVRQLDGFNPKLHRYKSGRLVPDQRVVVPTPAVVAAERVVPDPSIERYASEARDPGVHIVKRGENLSVIAARHHTTVKALMRANHLKGTRVLPGQALALPRASH